MVWMQGRDMAVDLGTANTRIHVEGRGVVLDEPSVLAFNPDSGALLAVGSEAKAMLGRAPSNVKVARPLRDGAIVDFDLTQLLLHRFLRDTAKRWLHRKPRVMVAIPTGITEVERRAVEEAGIAAGAQAVALVEQPLAAGIGAGLPVGEPTGSMVVDVGAGTTEVAVLSLGGIVASRSLRVAGDALDDAVARHLKSGYGLLVGSLSVERLKIELASLRPEDDDRQAQVVGRDVVTGLSKRVIVAGREIREVVEEPIDHIVEAVRQTLDDTPPELASDLTDRAIVIVGAGGQLPGLDEYVTHEIGLQAFLVEDPATAVVRGAAEVAGPWMHDGAATRVQAISG